MSELAEPRLNLDIFTINQATDPTRLDIQAGILSRAMQRGPVLLDPTQGSRSSKELREAPWCLKLGDDFVTRALDEIRKQKQPVKRTSVPAEIGAGISWAVSFDALRLGKPIVEPVGVAALVAIFEGDHLEITTPLATAGRPTRQLHESRVRHDNKPRRLRWLLLSAEEPIQISARDVGRSQLYTVSYNPDEGRIKTVPPQRGQNDDNASASGVREPKPPKGPQDSATIALKP